MHAGRKGQGAWHDGARRIASLIVAVAVSGSVAEADEVRASVRFPKESVRTVMGDVGDWASVEGCMLRTERPGAPDLPARLYRLVIPADLNARGVLVERAEFEAVDGEFRLAPAQPPRPVGSESNMEPVEPDPVIYGRNDPFPASPVVLIRSEFSFGYQLATLVIHPLRYYPVSGRLELLTALDFKVTGPAVDRDRAYARRRSQRSAAVVRSTIERLVENDHQISVFAPETLIGRSGDRADRDELLTQPWPSLEGLPVDYLIITSDALAAC
jgi:hypothetical protein